MGAFLNDYLYIFKIIFGIETNIPDINQTIALPIVYPISSIIISYAFNLSYKLYTENFSSSNELSFSYFILNDLQFLSFEFIFLQE